MTKKPQGPSASLLSIGEELLLGEITDTNSQFLSQQLRTHGVKVVQMETTGDELETIISSFKRAMERTDFLFSTGGLGPTADDLTTEAVAKALGVELEYHPEVMEHVANRLKRPVSSFSESNRKQGWIPQGARILQNDWGTAPGIYFKSDAEKHIFLLPGVPHEMKNIFRERIIPILDSLNLKSSVAIKSLHTFGIPESVIGDRIRPFMMAGQNPDVGTRYGAGIITVRLVANGSSEEEAREILQPALNQIRAELADGLYGEDEDTLASVTLKALVDRKITVSAAESLTAGGLCAKLVEIPGASASLMGGAVVYSNASKVEICGVKSGTLMGHGAVSPETAAELAQGIRERFKTDIGIGITGIAGPAGGSDLKPVGLVYFGIATLAGVEVLERRWTGLARNLIRERATLQGLDLIRRTALGEKPLAK